MKLSEIKGEAALDLLADLLEPAAEIMSDNKFKTMVRQNKSSGMDAAKYILKNHKKPILHIMALLDGENPETYAPNALALPAKLMEIFNDKEILSLFQSQGQNQEPTPSGPATEVTQA